MRTLIGIIGKGSRGPDDPVPDVAIAAAEEVGRLIAARQGVLLTGGLGGVMEAASKGAHEAGGVVVGILPGTDRSSANPYVDIPLSTGLGTIRNFLTVRASDAVIMISGGTGTLNELSVSYGIKPTIVLENTGGWAQRIRQALYEGKYLDERRVREIYFAQTPAEAVEMAYNLIARSEEGI